MATLAKPFLEIPRRNAEERPVEERIRDYNKTAKEMTQEQVVEQAKRCMNCGVPFCHNYGCPLLNVIPEINHAVSRGQWHKALDLLLDTSPFPEFTGIVCPALCEGSCVNGKDGDSVTNREIEHRVIETGYENGWVRPNLPLIRTNKRVAVIGSGPSGLSCAEYLNRAGINVTVYEVAEHVGGFMRYGIPDFRLPKTVVERRVELMKAAGVRFEMNVRIGKDISPEYLLRGNDAIVLCCGSRAPRDLKVPGRELSGIHFAVDYLTQQNRINGGEIFEFDETKCAKDKHVVVIGGGDTGANCIGTAIRQGAADVMQIEIMPNAPMKRAANNPWPEWPRIFKESASHKEGCSRKWNINTLEAIGENGKVKALRCSEIEWLRGEDGRMYNVPKKDGEFILQADLVLLAMGFVGHAIPEIVSAFNLRTDERGRIFRDSTGMTSAKGVYIAGDCATGQSLVVRAITDGKHVANGIIRTLLN